GHGPGGLVYLDAQTATARAEIASAPAAIHAARSSRSPMIAPWVAADVTEALLAADITEPKDAADPTEKADAAEPIEPSDMNEPTEPIDSIEPFDAIESIESSDHSDMLDPAIRPPASPGSDAGPLPHPRVPSFRASP